MTIFRLWFPTNSPVYRIPQVSLPRLFFSQLFLLLPLSFLFLAEQAIPINDFTNWNYIASLWVYKTMQYHKFTHAKMQWSVMQFQLGITHAIEECSIVGPTIPSLCQSFITSNNKRTFGTMPLHTLSKKCCILSNNVILLILLLKSTILRSSIKCSIANHCAMINY